jgi:N-acetylneuraminic acid mutarotase
MPSSRDCHSAVALADKIYVFGGIRAEGSITVISETNQLTDVFELDPACNRFTVRAPMPHPRTCAAATVWQDKIAIVGGYTNAPVRSADSTLLYDPASDTWQALPGLPTPRTYLAAAAVSGKLLAIGGYAGDGPLDLIEAYDPQTGTWSRVGALTAARFSHGAAVLGSAIAIVGGFGGRDDLQSVESLAAPFASTTMLADMTTSRNGPAVAEQGGYLYAVGGTSFQGTVPNLASAERLNPTTGQWEPIASLAQARSEAVAVAAAGRIYVIGGIKNAVQSNPCSGDCTIASLASVEVYTPPGQTP